MTVALTEPLPMTDLAPVGAPAPRGGWTSLLAQVGEEVAAPLAAALESLNALATSGRLDPADARELRDQLEAARRAAWIGRQLARHAHGRIAARKEPVPLTGLLRDLLTLRRRDFDIRGLPQRVHLVDALVIADPALLPITLHALLDWCIDHARSAVHVRLSLDGWPVRARLQVRFAHVEPSVPAGLQPRLDTLSWRLVEQGAQAMDITLARTQQGIETELHLGFPRTLPAGAALHLEDECMDSPGPSTSSPNSQPLAGSHVLVMASRREVRQQVREAIAHMGLVIDFVPSLDEARQFCLGGLPHAVVYEGALGGQRFDRFRDELRADVCGLVFIELVEDGDRLERSGAGGVPVARVGRRALRAGLPFALRHELSKNL